MSCLLWWRMILSQEDTKKKCTSNTLVWIAVNTSTVNVVYCIITIVTCFMYSETNTLSRFPCVKLWSCNFMLENKTNY